MQPNLASHGTIVYLHDFPCGAPRNKVAAAVPPHSHVQARLSRMTHHRDLAGESDWIAVDCDEKGAPMPVFIQPDWPNT